MVKGAEHAELILLSQCWPRGDRGYGLAVRASLKQYLKVFSHVHFLGLVPEAFAGSAAWRDSPVDWVQIPVATPPKWLRFLTSIARRLPASVIRYAPAAVHETIGRIHAGVQDRGRNTALIFEDLPVTCHLPAVRRRFPEIVMAIRSHNVMAKAFDGFQGEGSLPERIAWRIELAKIKHFEQYTCKLADRVWAISENDSKEYLKRLSVRTHGVLGVSLEAARYAAIEPGSPFHVIHVGSTDQRKVAGLMQFIRCAWPSIRAQVPQARLVLAGHGTERFADANHGVEVLGFVPDDKMILEKGLIFVNPQQIGSGVKLKSIVAMLAGRALVATPTGVEGVEGAHGKDFFVAPDMEAMGAQVVALLKDRELAVRVAESGRALATSRYSDDFLSRTALPLLTDFVNVACVGRS